MASGHSLASKISTFRQVMKQNGGVVGGFLKLFRTDELKVGDFIGEDKYGNKYYQNKMYFMGRSRWVEYTPEVGWDYDGSQVPAEWHRWLHYITDVPPTIEPPVHYKWMDDHTENFSGTSRAWVPYSTTKPKIESWQPPRN